MFAQRTSWNLALTPFARALEEHRRAGRELLDLSASNPTECGFHYDAAPVLRALANPASLSYTPEARGLRTARELVAGYYRDGGVDVGPESLLLTTSTSEAYSFVFRLLCDPGDEVLVPTPSYPLFDFLASIQDVTLRPYSLVYDHGWQMDFHSIEKALTPRTRAVLVVHPNNPTGSYVSPAEAAQLSALCRERQLAIVADEVFFDYGLDYALDSRAPFSFAANNAALTFTLSGLSKISALPQMKVAWLATSGPAELAAEAGARLEVIADTYLSMNAPVQHALAEMLELRRSIQPQLMDRVRANLQELDTQLGAAPLVHRLQVQGGWYAVLRVPALGDDEELAIALLREEGVLAHPGHFYNFESDGILVVSLITPAQVFAEGMRRLLEHVRRRCAA